MPTVTNLFLIALFLFSCSARANASCSEIFGNLFRDGSDYEAFKQRQKSYAQGSTMPFRENGELIPEELPDTLFQWVNERVHNSIEAGNQQGKGFMLGPIESRPRFFWKTPAGSFGYGKRLVRVKLKEKVQFKEVDWSKRECNFLRGIYDVENTVFISRLNGMGYHEYFLCGNNPIHSISSVTKQTVEQLRGEADWMLKSGMEDIDFLIKQHGEIFDPAVGRLTPVVDLRKGFEFDHFEWSYKILFQNLQKMEELLKSGSSPVHFNSGISANEKEHFSTNMLQYWLPRP